MNDREPEPTQTDPLEAQSYTYLWVAAFVAVIIGLGLKFTLPSTVDKTSDILAFYGFVGTMVTLGLVGYQVQLTRQQNRVLLRQDEILLRRENLTVDFDKHDKRFTRDVTVAEVTKGIAVFELPFRIENMGQKSASAWYLNVFIPDPNDRGFHGMHQDIWQYGDLVYIGPTQYRKHTFNGQTRAIFPKQSITCRFAVRLNPSNSADGSLSDVSLMWQAYGENGVYPAENKFGILKVNASLYH